MIIQNPRELGGFLRQAREDTGLTQADLADRLGVRRQRVLYLERGEGQLQIAFVFSVMRALNVDLSLTRAAEPVRTRRKANPAPPYSIDDIADGGKR